MKKKTMLFLFLLGSFMMQSQEWIQNKEKTTVTFKIKNFGVNVDGDFSDIKINTNLNSNNLENSFLNAEIIVNSISTGIKGRDKHILEEDYFDEPNHKKITLTSTKIEKTNKGVFLLHANLTIKGTSKKIKIPIEFQETNNSIMIQSKFQINRKDYKVGGGSLIMSKKVKIEVQFSGTR